MQGALNLCTSEYAEGGVLQPLQQLQHCVPPQLRREFEAAATAPLALLPLRLLLHLHLHLRCDCAISVPREGKSFALPGYLGAWELGVAVVRSSPCWLW